MSEWREVPDVPYFLVTADGRVKTKPFTVEASRNRWGKPQPRQYKGGEIRAVLVNPPGYLRVSSQRDKKRPRFYVHRLVARAFLDGYQDGYQVNHLNGIKTDNRVENLEWVPMAQNITHAWNYGFCDSLIGEGNSQSKLTLKQVIAIKDAISLGIEFALISRLSGVSHSMIDKIADNRAWIRALNKGNHGINTVLPDAGGRSVT
mgnify:FL=1